MISAVGIEKNFLKEYKRAKVCEGEPFYIKYLDANPSDLVNSKLVELGESGKDYYFLILDLREMSFSVSRWDEGKKVDVSYSFKFSINNMSIVLTCA